MVKTKLLLVLCVNIAFLPFLWKGQGVGAQTNRLWATYYGGTGNDFVGFNITTDAFGNVYITGNTTSTLSIASGGFQNTFGGGYCDAYLVKFNTSGTRLWATYYGGPGDDYGQSVATDAAGNVYMGGYTPSATGIASSGFQNNLGGGINGDAFLVKFDVSGNRIWATYYGGTQWDYGFSIATDLVGNVYLAGEVTSTVSIAFSGFQNTYGGGFSDAFLVKFDALTGNRVWATYYGGAGTEHGYSIATDVLGNVYLAGETTSTVSIASSGFQNIFGGGSTAFETDAFLVKFDASGTRLWATYYGGTGIEYGRSIATDAFDNVYLAGWTSSTVSITFNGFQNNYGGDDYDAYLVKFDENGTRLWATYYGGTYREEGNSVATDISGNVYLGGDTYSADRIASGGFQNSFVGNPGTTADENKFVVKFDSNGNRLCATYYCQDLHNEEGHVAVDGVGNVYLAGNAQSITGIASGGFQNTYGGGFCDAYLVKFSSCSNPLIVNVSSTGINCNGQCTGIGIAVPTGGASPYTYNWSNGQTAQTITGLCSGTYTVIITDFASATFTNTITIAEPALLLLTTNATNSLCNGGTGSATVNIAGGTTPYFPLWSNGQTSQTASLTAGTYTLTITDTNNCIITTTVTITEPAAFIPTITINNPICNGDSGSAAINLNGSTAPYSYLWSNGDTTFQISNLTSQIYSVTITDANGCILTQTLTISAITPPFTVTISATTTNITVGENTQLNVVTLSGVEGYLWTPSTGLSCSTCSSPTATPSTTTNYCLEVTDANGCNNSACITINVEELCGEIFIPNVFSPNNDGENDWECVFGTCIQNMSFVIFNRWGEKVFEYTGSPLLLGGVEPCWDGIYKGKIEYMSVFVWYINATLTNGTTINKTGNISLIK